MQFVENYLWLFTNVAQWRTISSQTSLIVSNLSTISVSQLAHERVIELAHFFRKFNTDKKKEEIIRNTGRNER